MISDNLVYNIVYNINNEKMVKRPYLTINNANTNSMTNLSFSGDLKTILVFLVFKSIFYKLFIL